MEMTKETSKRKKRSKKIISRSDMIFYIITGIIITSVSYTHLDVYKRQGINYQYKVGEDGKMRRLSYQCYEMWNRCKRCENCISAKCFHQKGKLEKFEFIENETYHVVAMYMEIDLSLIHISLTIQILLPSVCSDLKSAASL